MNILNRNNHTGKLQVIELPALDFYGKAFASERAAWESWAINAFASEQWAVDDADALDAMIAESKIEQDGHAWEFGDWAI